MCRFAEVGIIWVIFFLFLNSMDADACVLHISHIREMSSNMNEFHTASWMFDKTNLIKVYMYE